jgi:hypothetical protein
VIVSEAAAWFGIVIEIWKALGSRGDMTDSDSHMLLWHTTLPYLHLLLMLWQHADMCVIRWHIVTAPETLAPA